MADDEQSKGMTLNIPGLTEFVGSIWAKVLAVLTAISILLGIALEIQSFITGYYSLQKTIFEEKASELQPETAAAQLEITKANVIKAHEESLSAHAASCKERINVTPWIAATPSFQKWVIECAEYSTKEDR